MRSGRTGEVLLLEDDGDDAEIFRFVVERMRLPLRTTLVRDEEGMKKRLRRRPRPDIILIGTDLYGRDLERLLSLLKADPEIRHIPILILTDDDDPDHVKECYARHVAAYITKPVGMHDYEEFARALHSFWFETATLPHAE